MRPTSTLLAAASVVALLAGAASAKAPKPAEEMSVEDVWQQAQKDLAALKEKEKEASRDVLREQIDNYREKRSKLEEWKPLADVLVDDKTDRVQPYRRDAADALRVRFSKEDEKDPMTRATRRNVALAVLDLMKVDAKKDEIGLKAVDMLINAWWGPRASSEWKWKASDKQGDRQKAWSKAKKFLEKE
jgi:hypothetical protein